jgi:hypothetical protein
MRNTRLLKEKLGQRIEAVIENSPEPQVAMDEIAREAERVGLVWSESNLRRESATAFVMDLWVDNPRSQEMVSAHYESLPDPLKVNSLPQVLDLLR